MHYKTLAEKEGLGRIVMCATCNDVHMAVDNTMVRIPQDAFIALSEMIQESLKNPIFCKEQINSKQFMAKQLFSLA